MMFVNECVFFISSRRRHTRWPRDWSSDVCSSDLNERAIGLVGGAMTLGSAVATLPAGLLARRIGVRTPLIVCFIAAPVLGVLRALAMSEPLQIGLGFAAGLAMCLWGVCYLPALARLTTEDNRAFAFSLIFSASIGTSTLGGVVCGYLPQWLNN